MTATTEEPTLRERVDRCREILQATTFTSRQPLTQADALLIAEALLLLDGLLEQADGAGHRVDFMDEVGTYGKVQDITSLVASTAQAIRQQGALAGAVAIHWFYGAGVGYFANGVHFAIRHDDETTFFIYQNRVFLNRHLLRALTEAATHLRATT